MRAHVRKKSTDIAFVALDRRYTLQYLRKNIAATLSSVSRPNIGEAARLGNLIFIVIKKKRRLAVDIFTFSDIRLFSRVIK